MYFKMEKTVIKKDKSSSPNSNNRYILLKEENAKLRDKINQLLAKKGETSKPVKVEIVAPVKMKLSVKDYFITLIMYITIIVFIWVSLIKR